MKKLIVIALILFCGSILYGQTEDPAAGYKLQPTSPAIGHGIVTDGPKYDLYGNPRVDKYGQPRNDAGAIQYVEEPPPPPPDCATELAAAYVQIAALNEQVNNLQITVAALNAEIITYQSQIGSLQNQVASLQSSLDAANARITTLTKKINDALLVLKNAGKNKQQAISQAITILQAGLL